MRIDILSLFPNYFKSPLEQSLLSRAQKKGILEINCIDIRDFAEGPHRQVDDRPYGGGPGMVLMPKPVIQAIRSVKTEKSHVVYLSPQGTMLNAKKCRDLAGQSHLILLCGHYEGIDERVIESEVDEEISIGPYVLSNGGPAALVVLDGVSRLVEGVVGDAESTEQDSFENGTLDWPHYTRPEVFENSSVPEVLLSGNHQKILEWRRGKAEGKTKQRYPELLKS